MGTEQLDGHWRDEIVHAGLQLMNDTQFADPGSVNVLEEHRRSYWDWQEIAHSYDETPQEWTHNYFRNFLWDVVEGRGDESAERMSRGFGTYLDPSEIARIIDRRRRPE